MRPPPREQWRPQLAHVADLREAVADERAPPRAPATTRRGVRTNLGLGHDLRAGLIEPSPKTGPDNRAAGPGLIWMCTTSWRRAWNSRERSRRSSPRTQPPTTMSARKSIRQREHEGLAAE